MNPTRIGPRHRMVVLTINVVLLLINHHILCVTGFSFVDLPTTVVVSERILQRRSHCYNTVMMFILTTESCFLRTKNQPHHNKRRIHHHYHSLRVPTHTAAKEDPSSDKSVVDDDVNDNGNNDGQKTSGIMKKDPSVDHVSSELPSTWPAVMLATILFVSFWPLLAFVRTNVSNPIDGFDIDMYMALRGILDDNNNNINDVMSSDMIRTDTILELPALSPAERLVDAIFGPP